MLKASGCLEVKEWELGDLKLGVIREIMYGTLSHEIYYNILYIYMKFYRTFIFNQAVGDPESSGITVQVK
jgi:hypothetical protein